jgi:predicted dehydrogenase
MTVDLGIEMPVPDLPEVRIAMIGGGDFMGKAHALAYATMPMFFWPPPGRPIRHTLVEASNELAEHSASRFGFRHWTSDWREVLEDEDVDLIDIATPNHLHAEVAIEAAKAGKHIFCEKPLGRTRAESKDILTAVTNMPIVHMVSFQMRRVPAIALAREMILGGELGRILNFRATYLQDWPADPQFPLTWRFQKSCAGSGAIGDIGSHVIDLARYLVGEIASVDAQTRTYIQSRPLVDDQPNQQNQGDVDVDDEALAMLRFAGGAVGSIEVSRHAHGRHNYLTFEVHGSAGSLTFNYERRDELEFFTTNDPLGRRGFRKIYTGPEHPYGKALWPAPAMGIGYGESRIVQCHDLIKAITSSDQASPNFEDGYRTSCVVDAILDSAERGGWVDVDAT